MEWLASNSIFAVAAGSASLLSLCITAAIYLKLFRLTSRITLHSRRGSWLKALQTCTNDLAPLLRDHTESTDEIRELLAVSKPTLKALNRALPGFFGLRLEVLILRGMIYRYFEEGFFLRRFGRKPSLDGLPRAIYEKFLEISQSLKEQIAQSKQFTP